MGETLRDIYVTFNICNIILSLMGLGLMITGSLTLYNVVNVNTDHVKVLLDTVKIASFQVGTMAYGLCILFITIGILMLKVAVSGIFETTKKNPRCKIAVVVELVMLFVMKIVIIALWYTMKDKVESELKTEMVATLTHDFKDDTTTNTNSVSNAWNYMFMSLDCCAVDPVTGSVNDFDPTSWCTTSGTCQMTTSQIPKTCCINVDENNYSSAPSKCHSYLKSGTYNNKGCYNALKDTFLSHTSIIEGFAITSMVLEFVGVIILFQWYRKKKNEDHQNESLSELIFEIILC